MRIRWSAIRLFIFAAARISDLWLVADAFGLKQEIERQALSLHPGARVVQPNPDPMLS